MPRIDQLYEWLSKNPDPASDRILGIALPQAEPHWLERIVHILVERDRESAWIELISHYEHVKTLVDPLLDLDRDVIRAGIGQALKSPLHADRMNALRVLQQHPEPRLANAVAEAARDTAPAIRAAAGEILRALSGQAAVGSDRPAIPAAACLKQSVQAPAALSTMQTRSELRAIAPTQPPPVPAESVEPDNQGNAEFTLMWLACRRAFTTSKRTLTPALRRHASTNRQWLSRYMRSPDPRDRALALHIVNTDELTQIFRDDLERLRKDSNHGIRATAAAMLDRTSAPNAKTASNSAQINELDQAARTAYESARRSLRRTVEFLATGVSATEDADLSERVRELLESAYPVQKAGEPTEARGRS